MTDFSLNSINSAQQKQPSSKPQKAVIAKKNFIKSIFTKTEKQLRQSLRWGTNNEADFENFIKNVSTDSTITHLTTNTTTQTLPNDSIYKTENK